MANNIQPPIPLQPAAAQVRQRGNQSKRLVDIMNQITNGVLISHILNMRVSNEPQDPNEALQIRRMLKKAIWNVPNMHMIMHNGQPFPVGITWTMVNVGQTCAYYYAVNLPYSDSVVENHSRVMMNTIVNQIRQNHPEYGNDWGIAYLVTRPLALFQPIPAVPIVGGQNVQQIGGVAMQNQHLQAAELDDAEEEEE